MSFRDLAANSFINLLITFGIMGWAIQRYTEPFEPGKFVLFIFLILNGTFLFFTMHMLFTIPVFYTQSGQGFGDLMWTAGKLGERPDRIFSGWFRKILTSVLPIALISSFPSRLYLEPFDWQILLHTLGVSAVFFTILILAWNRALRSYSSASS